LVLKIVRRRGVFSLRFLNCDESLTPAREEKKHIHSK
jgi:hypothetical protein